MEYLFPLGLSACAAAVVVGVLYFTRRPEEPGFDFTINADAWNKTLNEAVALQAVKPRRPVAKKAVKKVVKKRIIKRSKRAAR